MNILQEFEVRLQKVEEERSELSKEQKLHSQKASEIQKSLIKLDSKEELIRELITTINKSKQL